MGLPCSTAFRTSTSTSPSHSPDSACRDSTIFAMSQQANRQMRHRPPEEPMTFKHEARRPATTWILVADRARARLFSAEWPELEQFQEIRDFAHAEGAAYPHDVEADGPGRLYGANGPRHAADRRTDFK